MRKRCRHVDGAIVCGGEPTESDRAAITRFRRFLAGEMALSELREYAGLSVGQAAKLLGITADVVRAIEAGRGADDLLQLRMRKMYGAE